MNPFKKKTDVESRAASSSEQALCSVCRHAIPESRRELGLCLDCSTKKDRNKAVLAVGLAGGALAVAKKYGPKVVSKVGPLVVQRGEEDILTPNELSVFGMPVFTAYPACRKLR